ncbi:hypothetical protein GJ496_002136 [Pomphorhynchus laevis]|nr:hypothetical protein GJ496_002136 [Pomphorhynchus laevis]
MNKLLKKVDKTAGKIAVKTGVRDAYAAASNRVADSRKPGALKGRSLLTPGYNVQLKNRQTEGTIQICENMHKQKALDATGLTGLQWNNAIWTVQQAASNISRIR